MFPTNSGVCYVSCSGLLTFSDGVYHYREEAGLGAAGLATARPAPLQEELQTLSRLQQTLHVLTLLGTQGREGRDGGERITSQSAAHRHTLNQVSNHIWKWLS